MTRAKCHPKRRCKAKGLCASCYAMSLPKKKALCHPEKRHKAKGLCGVCYEIKRKEGPQPLKLRFDVEKMMDNWLPKLDDPGIVVDLVRKIFSTQKELRGVYSA
jgi:hypothetical protein